MKGVNRKEEKEGHRQAGKGEKKKRSGMRGVGKHGTTIGLSHSLLTENTLACVRACAIFFLSFGFKPFPRIETRDPPLPDGSANYWITRRANSGSGWSWMRMVLSTVLLSSISRTVQ